MSKHYLIQVGGVSVFADRIDGFSQMRPRMQSEGKFYFTVYMSNGSTFDVIGTEQQLREESQELFAQLDYQESEAESHPPGESG